MGLEKKYVWDYICERYGGQVASRWIGPVDTEGRVTTEGFHLQGFKSPPQYEYLEATILEFYEKYPSERVVTRINVSSNPTRYVVDVAIEYGV